MTEGQIETITGDEMIRQPNQSISGYDGRPLTDCDGQCGGCTNHRPDELDADGEPGRCDDCEPGAIPCDEYHCQADPALKAIDKMVNEAGLDIKCSMGIRTNVPQKTIERHAESIRSAYLASQKTAATVKESLTAQAIEECMFERMVETVISWTAGCYPAETNRIKRALREAHNADRAADKQRIAELEAQTPKTVNPRMVANHWKCKCGAVLYPGKQHPETKKQWVPKYCMDCGSKLNWEVA